MRLLPAPGRTTSPASSRSGASRPAFRLVSTVALTGGMLLGTASLASAVSCDAYSGGCPTPPPSVLPAFDRDPTVQDNRATLPFTGGEVALLLTVGGVAVGAGTVLVVAGRRRSASGGTPAA